MTEAESKWIANFRTLLQEAVTCDSVVDQVGENLDYMLVIGTMWDFFIDKVYEDYEPISDELIKFVYMVRDGKCVDKKINEDNTVKVVWKFDDDGVTYHVQIQGWFSSYSHHQIRSINIVHPKLISTIIYE